MNDLAAEIEASHQRQSGTAKQWQIRDRVLRFGRTPLLMGIVNATPDSFSDGGRWQNADDAVERSLRLIRDGADIIDIGGESTRPYSQPVSADDQLERIIPVIQRLARETSVPISVDTSIALVARQAVAAGAQIINDVTGLNGDREMAEVVRETGAGVCVMHMQGTPQTMQDEPHYDDVVGEILAFLLRRKQDLIEQGIQATRICLDPGIGFGKTHVHNLKLLQHVARFHAAGQPLLIGHSRKGFIGKIAGPELRDRDAGTLGISLHLALSGIQILRLHEIAPTRLAISTLFAVRPDDLPFCYAWPRPSASVDLIITRMRGNLRELLLIRRRHDPFAGCWALPGGFVDPDETLVEAAARELNEETGVVAENLTPLGAWSEPKRDPRGRVISHAFMATVPAATRPAAADDAIEAGWHPIEDLPNELAFDHAEMIATAKKLF